MKIELMKQNQAIPSDLVPDFRSYVSARMLQVTLPLKPTQHDPQSDLQALGKVLFSLFDIYVED